MRTKIADWFDERLGTRAISRALFSRKIPLATGWVAWLYTLGSVTLFLFIMQAVTGMFLAMNYTPSPDHAFDAVNYISTKVPWGWLIRGLHHWGASAMVVVVALHLITVFLLGAYKYPREATWVVGVFLFVVVMLFGFTGYLLPWNQKAYWATVVGTNISREAPIFGPALMHLLCGGARVGARTLARFYALHVMILPAVLLVLVGIHLFMVVDQGVSAPPHRLTGKEPADLTTRRRLEMEDYHAAKEAGEPFYPNSLARDAVAVVVVFAVVFILALCFRPEVGQIANPASTSYNPRPEWYFLFLFQFLKLFPGWAESLVAVVLPSVAVLFLLLLPFLDRGARRHPFDRPLASSLTVVALGAFVMLTVAGAQSPRLSAYIPEPPMVAEGQRLFRQLDCQACHSVNGRGGVIGPDLALSARRHSKQWMLKHFDNPQALVPGSPMPRFALLPDEKEALVAYIEELGGGGPYSPEAPQLFATYCSVCHRMHGHGGMVGPDLSQIGLARSKTFIQIYVEDPKAVLSTARMPAFLIPRGPLTHAEIEDLARYLAVQR